MRPSFDSDPGGELEIPPAIACARCGETSCDGCSPAEEEPRRAGKGEMSRKWEASQRGAIRRLLSTAKASALNPEQSFGELQEGKLLPPLSFALLAETWAVGSYSIVWVGACLLFFPQLTLHMLTSKAAWLLAGGILLSLVLLVVAVHLAWGLMLEWSIGRTGNPSSYNLGLRFSLYSCGWDLLTSPAGLVFLIPSEGFVGAVRSVVKSTRVPRSAVKSYLHECRGLDDSARKKTIWISLLLFGLGLFAATSLLFVALLQYFVPGFFW